MPTVSSGPISTNNQGKKATSSSASVSSSANQQRIQVTLHTLFTEWEKDIKARPDYIELCTDSDPQAFAKGKTYDAIVKAGKQSSTVLTDIIDILRQGGQAKPASKVLRIPGASSYPYYMLNSLVLRILDLSSEEVIRQCKIDTNYPSEQEFSKLLVQHYLNLCTKPKS